MMLAKTLLFLVLPFALVGAISQHEQPENMPPKSEIVFRIKRLLQMLQDRRKDDAVKIQESREPLSSRSMIERRKRLEEALQENPGLRALIKKSLKNRKDEEVKMLENDPRRRCVPGIFFCRNSKSLSRDSDSNEDEKRSAALKKLSKLDDEISKRRRCRPGSFWCEKGDALDDTDSETLGQNQKKSLGSLETKAEGDGHITKHDTTRDAIDRLLNFISKDQQDAPRRRCRPGLFHCAQGDESHDVEVIRKPAESTKEIKDSSKIKEDAQRRRCRPGVFHCASSRDESLSTNDSKGKKLADDLMESLDTTKNAKQNDAPQKGNSNYDVDVLTKILEGTKR